MQTRNIIHKLSLFRGTAPHSSYKNHTHLNSNFRIIDGKIKSTPSQWFSVKNRKLPIRKYIEQYSIISITTAETVIDSEVNLHNIRRSTKNNITYVIKRFPGIIYIVEPYPHRIRTAHLLLTKKCALYIHRKENKTFFPSEISNKLYN